MILRLGSRGSRLALAQAELAADASARGAAELEIALVPITTAGDRDRTKPFGEIGERGVFVKEIEEALLAGRIDVAVHSAKDMTSTDTDGLAVGAYLPREDPRDALCGASDASGRACGSARRPCGGSAQLLALEPSLSIEPLRGNVDTRLRKRGERGLDAIVLAAVRARPARARGRDRPAASTRTRCSPRRARARSRCRCAPARRSSSPAPDDAETRRRVEAERACVAPIGGGCLAPVAAHHDGTRAAPRSSPPRTARGSSGAAATIRPRSPRSCSLAVGRT